MRKRKRRHLRRPLRHISWRVILPLLVVSVTIASAGRRSEVTFAWMGSVIGSRAPLHENLPISPTLLNQAHRLMQRLEKNNGKAYPLAEVARGLQQRNILLGRSLTVQWDADDETSFEPWTASAAAFPFWVQPDFDAKEFSYDFNADMILRTLETSMPSTIVAPIDTFLLGTKEDHGVLYAVTSGRAEPGYVVDEERAAKEIRSTLLASTQTGVMLPVDAVQGMFINQGGVDLGPLTLLATGRSNFAGSGQGRISNVRKGLHELIHNIVIPPGATFSFNRAVNNMNVPGGWEDALVIFNGKDLISSPGGGICQVATTVYRAALNAGMPIVERANHSLYVTYYAKYGVGIDATVYPKRQDLVFVNDTGNYLLLQAYAKGFEAYVNVYGAPDGRSVALRGPFFSTNTTSDVLAALGAPVRKNEIAWLHVVRYADGVERNSVIRSRYSSIPKSVRDTYAKTEELAWRGF